MKSFAIFPHPGPQIPLQVQSEPMGTQLLAAQITPPSPSSQPFGVWWARLERTQNCQRSPLRSDRNCRTRIETMPSQPSPKGLSYIPPSSPCALPFPPPSYAGRCPLMNNSRGNSPNHHTSSPRGLCVLLPGFGVQVKSHSSGQVLYYFLPDWHTGKAVLFKKVISCLDCSPKS